MHRHLSVTGGARGVERVEQIGVPGLDRAAPYLQRRGEVTALDGQVVVEDQELLDRLPRRQRRVELLDVAAHGLGELRRAGDGGVVGVAEPVPGRPGAYGVRVEVDQGGDVLAAV